MIYILTSGSYSDYRIVGLLEGPVDPKTLFGAFMKRFGIPWRPRSCDGSEESRAEYTRRWKERQAKVSEAAVELGVRMAYCISIDRVFVAWLKHEQGFTEPDNAETEIDECEPYWVNRCEKPFFVFFMLGDSIEKEIIKPGYLLPQFQAIRKRPGFADLTSAPESVFIPGPSTVSDNDETIPLDGPPIGTLEEQAQRSGCCTP